MSEARMRSVRSAYSCCQATGMRHIVRTRPVEPGSINALIRARARSRSVGRDRAQCARFTPVERLRARELLAAQAFGHSTREQQPVQRALILGEHAVWRTGGKANA